MWVQIDSAKIDDNIQIEIYDNAGGVAQEIISKVFEPYFTTKHQTQGKGLGLFGVYQLIKNTYHGSISGQNHTFVHQNQSYTGFKKSLLP
ncbi:MAG: HAMP domain-containing histidine kinase [Campylobacterales bacterium]|nr:HAMP domain-containing histidine kinase [Campylobacterales bacterium]